MQKKIISILVCMLLLTSAFIIASADSQIETNVKKDFVTSLDAPGDFNLDAYCGGYSPWEDWYRIQIDSEGHGIYSICYAEDRDVAEYTEIDQFDLSQNELDQLWDEIVESNFFNLNEEYSELDIFPGTDLEISGGTFANIIITGDGQEHMVETQHIGVSQFDNIMMMINTVTPGDSDLFYNGLLNNPPFVPAIPSGPTSGHYRFEHTYTSSAVDIDNDNLYYRFDWGDGEISDWTGPFESGEIASINHKWASQGDYEVQAQVKDDPNGDGDLSDGIESAWSDTLAVALPRAKVQNTVIFDLLEKIVNKFPVLTFLFRFSNQDTSKIRLLTSDPPPPPTEIKLDEANCKITITIRIQIWGEGASDALASSMKTAIENLLNKDKEGKPWKLKCPKDECTKEDPGCSVEIDMIIKNAGNRPPKDGQGYHIFYVAASQSVTKMNPGGNRFVAYTWTSDSNKNDNLVDYPRPNDATTNYPQQGNTRIFHNGATHGCLHANDRIGTWAHEFLHCLGLADKYDSVWTDADHDNQRDADEVENKPKPGHEDDIMANATKWLQQWAIDKTMERINLKCPCKCCPDDKDNTPPETKVETPTNGGQVSNPLIVGGYADDGPDGSGVALLDYLIEWDGGNYDGADYPIDPPRQHVQYELGPLELGSFIQPGDWISITVFATDDAGNTGSDMVTVTWEDNEDITPPVTEKIIGEPNENGGYIIWPFTPITFEATDDDSGVDYIYYEVWWDSDEDEIVDIMMGSEKVYDETLTFSVDMWGVLFGYMELRWFAVDNAGNPEDMHYQEHFVNPG